ncbi:MAG: Virginiamycin B lyase [Euryarchaeota archaeon ADurb.BinA087]|nr:MAG: Virginiamycin B lyase [Euryarchaeota archaeon ADurb.BinA087]
MRNYIVFILMATLMLCAIPETAIAAVEFYDYDLKWGSYGTADGQFNNPRGVAVDGAGNVYVADTQNDRVQKFTVTGTFITKWGSNGPGDGKFSFPHAVAVDTEGNVYVADTYNHRIQKFTPNGTFIMTWGEGPELADGKFSYPHAVAVDTEGNVYVADSYNHRIQKFNRTGSFITKWGDGPGSGDGQFYYPFGIAVDNAGNVYVADSQNNRIQKFNATGTFIMKWGDGPGSEDGQFYYPFGIAVDNAGNLYVAEYYNHRIQKFTPNGSYITKWGSYGPGDGQFNYPFGIAVDNAGKVYVVDSNRHRIQKFFLAPLWVTLPNGGETWTQGSKQTIRWEYLGEPGPTVRIDVMKGSNVLGTIPSVPAGSEGAGSYNLTLPYNAPLGSDFRVKVTSTSNATFSDTSNNPFTIGPAITMVSPNGGENYMQGSPQTLKWNYTNTPGATVKIEAMRGETVLAVIIPATSIGSGGQGSFNLTIPYHTPLGSDYRIQITSTTYPGCTDTSNASFSIVPNTTASITLVSPDGGENYLQGSTQTINWTYTGDPGPMVKIEALRGEAILAVITPATSIGSAGSGSFNLTFPYNTPLGSDYRIRVSSTVYPTWTDSSENPFTISPAITVVSPDGGSYPIGSTLPMGWTYTGSPGATVMIDVIKGNSTLKTLTGIPIGSGWYNVTIPASTPTGSDYRVRVTSTTYPACSDTSDIAFAII